MFNAEVRTKFGFCYNFVETIIDKKSYDRSCISWYMVTRDFFFWFFKLHSPAARAILRILKTFLYISKSIPPTSLAAVISTEN